MEPSHLREKLRKSIEMFLKFVFKIPKNSGDKFITSKRVMKLNKNSTKIILMKYRIKNRLVKFQNVLVAVRMELRAVIIILSILGLSRNLHSGGPKYSKKIRLITFLRELLFWKIYPSIIRD